jgi:hypothetical protein
VIILSKIKGDYINRTISMTGDFLSLIFNIKMLNCDHIKWITLFLIKPDNRINIQLIMDSNDYLAKTNTNWSQIEYMLHKQPTMSLIDLDQGSNLIIFESILTTFEANSIF